MKCYYFDMERIGVRELRQNASRYLDRVEAGETIEITERGRLVALLVPPAPGAAARDRLIAEGRLIPSTANRLLPRPVVLGSEGPSTSDLLTIQREDRL